LYNNTLYVMYIIIIIYFIYLDLQRRRIEAAEMKLLRPLADCNPLWPQNKRLHTPRTTADYRHTRQDRWIQTELAFSTCKECHKTESLWNHTATDRKEGEQLEDRRIVGESSCNCGDGTDQRVQSLMFMMKMMMMMMMMTLDIRRTGANTAEVWSHYHSPCCTTGWWKKYYTNHIALWTTNRTVRSGIEFSAWSTTPGLSHLNDQSVPRSKHYLTWGKIKNLQVNTV
jgi:hypothetical protein